MSSLGTELPLRGPRSRSGRSWPSLPWYPLSQASQFWSGVRYGLGTRTQQSGAACGWWPVWPGADLWFPGQRTPRETQWRESRTAAALPAALQTDLPRPPVRAEAGDCALCGALLPPPQRSAHSRWRGTCYLHTFPTRWVLTNFLLNSGNSMFGGKQAGTRQGSQGQRREPRAWPAGFQPVCDCGA